MARMSIQSVARAARILVAIAHEGDGLTASDVAARFDLALPTAYHLLTTLAEEGIVTKAEGKRYVLGPAADDIANSPALRPRIAPAARAALRRLADETRETAFLSGWHRGRIRILATVEGAQAVRVAGLQVGLTGSVHARASAKVLLAGAEPALRAEVLDGHDFVAYTPRTIVDRAAFDAELERVRTDGLGHDREEYREGVHAVSAPIRQDGQVVAALTVSAPAERYARTETEIVRALREAASAASA
jgi:IclR family transcriptional regulator, acetate operon repressor